MVESIKVPLIVIGVALALAIIVSLAVFKMGKPARKLTRSTASTTPASPRTTS